jgi:hypothetical protein
MEVTNIVSLGFAPNGVELFSWFEGETQYFEYWAPCPGGGLIQVRAS